jgi:uncharacterized protein (TIGR03435 family)
LDIEKIPQVGQSAAMNASTFLSRHVLCPDVKGDIMRARLESLGLLSMLCFMAIPFCATAQVAFEAASIHPNNSGSGSSRTSMTNHRLTASNVTVKALMITAYKIQDYQIIGGQPWIGSDRFDIVAKAEENADAGQVPEMIRGLLAERFKLRFHHETRALPVYALVVTDRAKLKPNSYDGEKNHNWHTDRGKLDYRNMPFETFVIMLSNQVDRLVVNRTGLTGNFDLQLEWSPEATRAAAEPAGVTLGGPSIFTALREQLGLRLEATKAPVDAIVIDSLERPSEN